VKIPDAFRHPTPWILGLVALAVAVVAVVRGRGPLVPVTTVTRRNLEQHVVASGRVWVPTRVQISAQVPGLVVGVGAVEGQHVQRGQLLVQIDDAEARNAVAQTKAAVLQAAARVEQLRRVGSIVASEDLRESEVRLERARTELAKVERLEQTGSVPRIELDNARREVDIAQAKKNAAAAQQLSATSGADSRVALSALLQAEAQLAGSNVRLAHTRIEARDDGVVLSREVEPGDVVRAAEPLLVMAVDAAPELVFQPDERNLAFLQLGQKARASADAFPQEVFDAEVSYIAPAIDPQRGSIEVRLRSLAPPAFLKPDMTVSIDLTVAAKRNVLTLPSESVRGAGSAAPSVLVLEDSRAAPRVVKLGIAGEGTTEIVSGLSEGAQVLVPRGLAILPGQRVRAERD
jgi:HlyD family secretion protein